jgi:hypothetical protein
MCIIVFIHINNNIILFKNRDRLYKTKIKIIHTIINNIELAYLYDVDTTWIEGINEHGVALVNSALQVKDDEVFDFNNDVTINKIKAEKPGKKILNSLTKTNIKDAISSVLNYKAGTDSALMGHTLISDNCTGTHIEVTKQQSPTITNLGRKTVVLTNHGVYSNTGYNNGRKKVSSILRKKIVEEELKSNDIENYFDLFTLLNKDYIALDPRFNPYRNRKCTERVLKKPYDSNTKIFSTNCQIMFNLNELEFNINIDKDSCVFIETINEFPKNYIPKIKINIFYTNKNINKFDLPDLLTEKYIRQIMDRYNYKI